MAEKETSRKFAAIGYGIFCVSVCLRIGFIAMVSLAVMGLLCLWSLVLSQFRIPGLMSWTVRSRGGDCNTYQWHFYRLNICFSQVETESLGT